MRRQFTHYSRFFSLLRVRTVREEDLAQHLKLFGAENTENTPLTPFRQSSSGMSQHVEYRLYSVISQVAYDSCGI